MSGRARMQQDFPNVAGEIDNLCRQSDYGYITRQEFNDLASELVGLPPEQIQEKYYNTEAYNEQLIDWFRELKKTGNYKIGIISNVGRNWLNKLLEKIDQNDLFDEIMLSSDMGISKPDIEVYQIMASRLGLPEEECVMVDDKLENIEGANLAGMRGIVFGSNRQLQEDFNRLVESQDA